MNTLTVYSFRSRKNPMGQRLNLSWEEFKARLRNPIITDEFMSEYFSMTNEEKTDVKDVGGYVAGELTDGRRAKTALVSRCLLTVDADDAHTDDWDNYSLLYEYACCCHTTHTSTEEHPRLRWLFPLTRSVTADEYTQLVNTVAKWVGADTVDDSTDQPERLMFWPSVSIDGDYHFWECNGAYIDPDEFLEDFVPTEPKPKKEQSGTLSIGEGNRNKAVFSFAASLRNNGLDEGGISSMLRDYNERYCDPPLPESELSTIIHSVCSRYSPGDVIPGSLRDAWDDFNDLGEWKPTEPKKIESLEAESMAALRARHIDPPKFVVDGLITVGINILASPPKFGKSWMCMDLAQSVSLGEDFLDMTTTQGGVLYLALEDGDYRLQSRSIKVGGSRPPMENLYLVKQAPLLQDGLLTQIQACIHSVSNDIRLVIIDTLQKIRGTAGKTEGVYGYDYRELGDLHQFALDNSIALVLVHHLNKGGDDSDFVNRLNGSTGISGAADTIITLTRNKRGDDQTKMTVTGRDVPERTMVLKMNWSTFRWENLGEEHEVESESADDIGSDPIAKTIIRNIEEIESLRNDDEDTSDAVWEVSPQDLVDEANRLYGLDLELSSVAVGRTINKIAKHLEENEGISISKKRSSKTRTYIFTRPQF